MSEPSTFYNLFQINGTEQYLLLVDEFLPERPFTSLFVGKMSNMAELEITSAALAMDNETHIQTPAGKLFLPGMFDNDASPSWANLPITQLKVDGYLFTKTPSGFTVSLKHPNH